MRVVHNRLFSFSSRFCATGAAIVRKIRAMPKNSLRKPKKPCKSSKISAKGENTLRKLKKHCESRKITAIARKTPRFKSLQRKSSPARCFTGNLHPNRAAWQAKTPVLRLSNKKISSRAQNHRFDFCLRRFNRRPRRRFQIFRAPANRSNLARDFRLLAVDFPQDCFEPLVEIFG